MAVLYCLESPGLSELILFPQSSKLFVFCSCSRLYHNDQAFPLRWNFLFTITRQKMGFLSLYRITACWKRLLNMWKLWKMVWFKQFDLCNTTGLWLLSLCLKVSKWVFPTFYLTWTDNLSRKEMWTHLFFRGLSQIHKVAMGTWVLIKERW